MAETLNAPNLHPAARLVVWLSGMFLAFLMPTSLLPWALLGFLLVGGAALRQRFMRLVRRSRWLLLAIIVAMTLTAPGEHLLPGYPGTKEGLGLATVQAVRLLVALMAVSWLLAASHESLISGLRSLLRAVLPSSWVDRTAVRIALVLVAIEDRRMHWRDLLKGESDVPARTEVRIPVRHLSPRDVVFAASSVAVALAVWLARVVGVAA